MTTIVTLLNSFGEKLIPYCVFFVKYKETKFYIFLSLQRSTLAHLRDSIIGLLFLEWS